MRRRTFLATAGATGAAAGLAGCLATVGLGDGGDRLPHRVETLDARGSSAGETLVPTPDTPTVVDLFATWCAPCEDQLDALAEVHPEYDGVSFVSVTNERPSDSFTREDVASWWNRNGGDWTLRLDPGGDLLAAFGATGLPYIAVVGADGTVAFEDGGVAGAETLRSTLDDVV